MKVNPPTSMSPMLMSNKRIVGSSLPLVGTGWAASVDSGMADGLATSSIVGVGVSVTMGVAVGVNVADGVATPNTCVPLLRISNI